MPIYRVQGPDGKIHKFEGPEGATPAEIEEAASAQFGQQIEQSQPKKTTQPVKSQAQPEEAGFFGGLGNLLYGAAKASADAVQGPAQLSVNLANYIDSKLPPADPKHPNRPSPVSRWANSLNQHVIEQERRYQNDTPGSVMAGTGRVVGTVLPFLLSGGSGAATNAVRSTGLAKALQSTASGALQGTGFGAIQPVLENQSAPSLESLISGKPNEESYWQSKARQLATGAVAGGVLGGVGAGIGSIYNSVRPLVSPKSAVGDLALDGIKKVRSNTSAPPAGAPPEMQIDGLLNGLTPEAVIARLNSASEIIPGSSPTTAQVAGIPQLVMAEKTLKNNPAYREAFENRTILNNAARMEALRGVARTPDELAAAIKARSDKSNPLYNAFNAQELQLDDALSGLLSTPVGSDATRRAAKLAANAQKPFGLTPGESERIVPSQLLGPNGAPLSSTVIPAQPGKLTGEAANQIKMSLDAMKRDVPTAGIESHEAGALARVRNQFVDQLDAASPLFKEARQAYAQGSIPVNTMEAGQSILNSLSGLGHNVTGDVAPMLSQYRTQLAKALANSKYGIEPEAQKTLQAIQQDMQRETISNSIRSSGSDTAFNVQAPNWLASKLYGAGMDGKGASGQGAGAVLGYLSGGPFGALGGKVAMEKLGSFVGNRVNNEFQQAMLEPKYFAKLLAEALERQSKSTTPIDKLAPVGSQAAAFNSDVLPFP